MKTKAKPKPININWAKEDEEEDKELNALLRLIKKQLELDKKLQALILTAATGE